MTTTETPKTVAEIRERYHQIAPRPTPNTPLPALELSRHLALSAQRGFARSVGPHAEFDHREILLTCAQFAALHTLTRLAAYDPNEADRLAVQIMNAWDDGGGVGEHLWEHAKALDLDPEEIQRLADAEARIEGERAGETDKQRADRLQRACITLGKTITSMGDTMYAARIEHQQNGGAAAMAWIINGMPEIWDGDPGTDWDGKESARDWVERTDAARDFNDDQPVRIVSRPGPDVNTVLGVMTACPTSADVVCAVPNDDGICGAKLDGGPCKAHDEAKATPETAPERERTEPTGM